LLPVPGCDCGSPTAGPVPRAHTDRSVEASLERAERALDELVGPVYELGEAESFPVPYYLAQLPDTAGFSDATAAQNAAGVDPDWNRAFMKALGEALERYCAGVYQTTQFERGTPDAVDGAVDPAAFVCRTRPDGEPIRWVSGTDLTSGESVRLPAAFVTHPPPERRYRPAVTTGLGFGNSGVGALLAGLYEVIERDAAMLAWYSSFEPLALTAKTERVETMRSRAASKQLDVTLLLLTMDVDVPVVAAVVHREEWPRFAAGTAADLDAGAAAESALAEALQNWMELRGMGPERAANASGAIGTYADLPDRARAFLDTTATVAAEDVSTPVSDGQTELETILDRLAAVDLDAYAARTTTRDVEMLGFEAVRVLVPAAQPLAFGDLFFGERAESAPSSLGFEPRLNREHHPFP
jgi:bacteriocin biosynthesis docking scaffold, SagD family